MSLTALDLLTTREASELLGITPRRVIALIHQAKLPAIKRARDWLIDPAHLSLVKDRKPGCPPGARRKARSYSEPTQEMREAIFARDGRQCQYCGDEQAEHYIIEHVLFNGLAFSANLVVACRSCNAKKKREVWIPRNFEQITLNHEQWRLQLLQSASRNFSSLSSQL
jgi:excisionase family DNA binding protein